MSIPFLHQYTRAALETMPVAGNPSLRAMLKAEMASGTFNGGEGEALLKSWGANERFGIFVSGVGKADAVNMLCGISGPVNGSVIHHPAPAPAPVAPVAVPGVDPAAAGLLAQLLATLGGATPEKINAQIKAEMAGPVAEFNSKLAESQGKVQAALDSFAKWQGDQQKGIDALRAEMLAGRPVQIEIKRASGEVKSVSRQHYLFPLILKIAAARCHAYLVGPAGSGKTSTAHAVADALELKFGCTSVCEQTSKTDLLGFFIPGTGAYQTTEFRERFEHGGVFLLDEADAGNANVIAVLNAALANDSMSFPDGMIKRHADFVLLAAANTFGTGADRLYVGRNELDGATLDRFVFVDFPYDRGLTSHWCGITGAPSPALDLNAGGTVTLDGWIAFCDKVEAAVDKLKIRAIVSPRARIYGARLAAEGVGRDILEKALIWKGLDTATIQKVRAAL